MQIAKVMGHVVSTQKDPRLTGFKLLLVVRMKSRDVFEEAITVAVDAVGAGIGEIVLVVGGSTARLAIDNHDAPVDCTIVGVIDTIGIY